jgi:nanoRNase/pAp phosphatase (c-di-AMP/oligoRNAs hydrolase)
METSNPKSSLVDAIKKSTNILVTVSHNPSVDALAAALGFSLMLNKLDKHATAVFSGAIPPAISFLEPEKNFEGSVSSLRDFIIALDKEKADRLRYKVEGDVVRIYITPYKTTITQKDLEFSEGDFNVDLVIALGVEKQSDLDNAISAHGRILHDGTVATVNLQNAKTTVGSINWNDEKASSLCEMLMSLSEALQSNLLDEQIATALLTGIVAATDRFSNEHTSPRVMTMSAQLMAAGANQQLIARKARRRWSRRSTSTCTK